MKSIKRKIMLSTSLIVAISLLIVGGTAILLNYTSTYQMLETTMRETAEIAAERVSTELQLYMQIAEESGCIANLSSSLIGEPSKRVLLEQRVSNYGLERGNILDKSGKSIFDKQDFSDRDYFQRSMKGEIVVSEPVTSEITGKQTVVISAPLWQNGKPDSTIVGVVYYVPKETFLNDIMSSVKVSKNSGAYIIDQSGNTIADSGNENVANNENIEVEAQTNTQLTALANLHADMRAGNTGFGTYQIDGNKKFLAYAPIASTSGWSLGVNALTSDFMNSSVIGLVVTAVLMVVALVVAIIISTMLATRIANPIRDCANRLTALAEGDLTAPVPTVKAKDETLILANATTGIVNSVSGVTSALSRALNAIAEGNLTPKAKAEFFPGDYIDLMHNLTKVFEDLNSTISQIEQASQQVASGAEQVSGGAQSLSQGATEQAASIEELSATIEEISRKIKTTAENAQQANKLSNDAGEGIMVSNSYMHDMIAAMQDISSRSSEIGKIIKTIDDIAFQTNILALNAAVEAARAGAAGKGFAVVADEVRNLAQKSAEAAKNTTTLIEGTVAAVNKGTQIADATAEALEKVVQKTQAVSKRINEIANASEGEATAIVQVTTGVDQISAVVQTNSATSEESAAASEELSGQAQLLRELVSQFTLAEQYRMGTGIDFAETVQTESAEPQPNLPDSEIVVSKY